MNIFTMLSSSRGSKIGNVIKFSNYKSSVLHTELRVSTLVLFIMMAVTFKIQNTGTSKRHQDTAVSTFRLHGKIIALSSNRWLAWDRKKL